MEKPQSLLRYIETHFPANEVAQYKAASAKRLRIYAKRNQFRQIIKTDRDRSSQRILTIISKFSNVELAVRILSRFFTTGQPRTSDVEIYEEIRAAGSGKSTSYNPREKDKSTAEYYFNKLPPFKVKTAPTLVVDIGCGLGNFIEFLGTHLGAKISSGCDIKSWDNYGEDRNKNIDFRQIVNGVLPYDDASCDLVSAQMMLHHVENLPKMLLEVKRILKPGGLFLIREHDAITATDHMIADIEHICYELLEHPKDPVEKCIETHQKIYSNYRNYMEWDALISPIGKRVSFGYECLSIDMKIAAAKPYYAIYQSPA